MKAKSKKKQKMQSLTSSALQKEVNSFNNTGFQTERNNFDRQSSYFSRKKSMEKMILSDKKSKLSPDAWKRQSKRVSQCFTQIVKSSNV